MLTDKALIKMVTDFRKGIINKGSSKDNCFKVCAPLHSFLSICGVRSELVKGAIHDKDVIYEHFWLKLPDSRIIDPTADQFKTPDGGDMPVIFLGAKPEWYNVIID